MPRQTTALETRTITIIDCLTPAVTILNDFGDVSGTPFATAIAKTTVSLITMVQVVPPCRSCTPVSLGVAECEEEQGRMHSTHGDRLRAAVRDHQCPYQVKCSGHSPSFDLGSPGEIHRVLILSPLGSKILTVHFRTLHKVHTFVEGQQGGNMFKQFLRQSEMNTLLKECQRGLQQALDIFKVSAG
jgi:hypothetical protein